MKPQFLMMALAVALMAAPAFAGNCDPCDQVQPCNSCNSCYSKPCDLFAGLKSLLACKPCTPISTCDPCEPIVACCDPCANVVDCNPCDTGCYDPGCGSNGCFDANCDPCDACCTTKCGGIFDKPRLGLKKFFDGLFKPRCGVSCDPCCEVASCDPCNEVANCDPCGNAFNGCGCNDGCNDGCYADCDPCAPSCGFKTGTFGKKFARWWKGLSFPKCGPCDPCGISCDPCGSSYGCGCSGQATPAAPLAE